MFPFIIPVLSATFGSMAGMIVVHSLYNRRVSTTSRSIASRELDRYVYIPYLKKYYKFT